MEEFSFIVNDLEEFLQACKSLDIKKWEGSRTKTETDPLRLNYPAIIIVNKSNRITWSGMESIGRVEKETKVYNSYKEYKIKKLLKEL
jgi:hypothetical protein